MLQDHFFKITGRTGPREEITPAGVPAQKFSYQITTRQDHPVFAGHFPGNPVTPGVFQVRIIHELVALSTGKSLRLTFCENIKYLSLMIPSLHHELNCDLVIKKTDENNFAVTASISASEIVFIKFKGIFGTDDK